MKKGFTLIELLVVVLIIGILSAVALPKYQTAVWKSRFATLKPLVKAVADAEEVHYMETGAYTNDVDNLGVTFPGVISQSVTSNKGTYHLSWGRCVLIIPSNESGTSYVECFLKKGENDFLSYAVFLQHSASHPGKQYCGGYGSTDLNSIQQRVCRSESGLSAPTETRATYLNWHY
ncbi:type IV pilin protein [Candidatus Avelusimicrobium sp.]